MHTMHSVVFLALKQGKGRLALVDSESAYHAGITLVSTMQKYMSDIAAQNLREESISPG